MYKYLSLPFVAWSKSSWIRLAMNLVIGPRRSPLCTRCSSCAFGCSRLGSRHSSLGFRRSWLGPLPSESLPLEREHRGGDSMVQRLNPPLPLCS